MKVEVGAMAEQHAETPAGESARGLLSPEFFFLLQRMDRSEEKLSARIDQVEEKLTARINQVEARISQVEEQVADLRVELGQRFGQIEAKFEQRLGTVRAELIKWMFIFWVSQVAVVAGLVWKAIR